MKLSNSALTIGIIGVVLGAFLLMGAILFLAGLKYLPGMWGYMDPAAQRMIPPPETLAELTPFAFVFIALALLCILSAVAFLNNKGWGRKGFIVVLAGLILCGLAQHLTYCTALSGIGNNLLFYMQLIYGTLGLIFWCAIMGVLIWFLRRPALRKQFAVK